MGSVESCCCCAEQSQTQPKLKVVNQRQVNRSFKPFLYSPDQGCQRGVSPRHSYQESRNYIQFQDPPQTSSRSKIAFSDQRPDVMLEVFRRFPSYRNGKVVLQDIEQNMRTVFPKAYKLQDLSTSIAMARKHADFDQVDIEGFRKFFSIHFKSVYDEAVIRFEGKFDEMVDSETLESAEGEESKLRA
ncbi:hypothetical protein GUITHDRAFT_118022 [Guillardia theta CCMP2712]|uniref:EF-hand domain-containing protein n=1 Tax=Guillardia theta (strain CCMP2712) TaxID=905079 RepID=L1IIY8_GUITC|nr:hypothetical protein GUITHDRAFT_118022 [Guillardia theta CCMP2712]EKX35874.1 hypothetical protein GUITHDRAFT_118022 [Guillardia theta CCMP2712]|eukprot:XP_005822854.1 hypothetical protein GUITHDRAFT_118022 [Guillardia theta CCMP2712]